MRWPRIFRWRRAAEKDGGSVANAHNALLERSGPPAPAGEPRVQLMMADGTSVSPPNDAKSTKSFGYLARNLIPGAGKSEKNPALDD